MQERPFIDRKCKPNDETIHAALGGLFAYYQKIIDVTEKFSREWIFAMSSGWMQKIFDGKKALLYVIPLYKGFIASMAIREQERDAFLTDISMKALHGTIAAAKKYSEGYAIRFTVTGKKEYQLLETFIRKLIAVRG
ncbi:MAG: DUF3788 family protein [Spirochaetes bacterium]|nr:DUF3788 family protein [Spirochaetota bacterium]